MTLCSVCVAKSFPIGGSAKSAHFLLVLVALMMPTRGTYSYSRACIAGLTPKSRTWRFRQINEKRVRLESATQPHRTEHESVRVVPVGQASPRTSPGLAKRRSCRGTTSEISARCPELSPLVRRCLGVDCQNDSVSRGAQLVIAFLQQINYHACARRLRSVLCHADGPNTAASHWYAMHVKGKHSILKIHYHAVRVAQGTQFRESPLATSTDFDTGLRVF